MKKVLFLIMFFILTSFVFGVDVEEYNSEYTIVGNKVIVQEEYKFPFLTSEFSLEIPADSSAIEIEGLEFVEIDLNFYKKVIVSGELFNSVKIKYITSAYLERTKDNFFIRNYDLDGLGSVKVILPEGATLKYSLESVQKSVIPEGQVTTDGKSLIVQWDSLQGSEALLIIYNDKEEFNYLILIIGGLVFLVVILYILFKKEKKITNLDKVKKEDNNSKEDLTKNLFEEEKVIVEVLLEKGELWQKQLVIHTGISKVKLSRRLRNLEAKGVIEKIHYGNTNKIRLKK